MTDYIRRDTLIEDIDEAVKHRGMGEIIGQTLRRYILRQPAADVAEVVHGQMLVLDECSNSGIYCTACKCRIHREDFVYKILRAKYCPNCGAKMDGGKNNVSD